MNCFFYTILLLIAFAENTFAQNSFPYFMEGTWQQENANSYEHWDKVKENTLKGIVYELMNGQPAISEYLDMSLNGSDVVYTATVLGQNMGKGVDFKLIKTEDTYSFENPGHDFPKKIVYKKLNDNELLVEVSGERQKSFSYKLIKQKP